MNHFSGCRRQISFTIIDPTGVCDQAVVFIVVDLVPVQGILQGILNFSLCTAGLLPISLCPFSFLYEVFYTGELSTRAFAPELITK
jgi:hypothetical protein